jgi:hypothetical protein
MWGLKNDSTNDRSTSPLEEQMSFLSLFHVMLNGKIEQGQTKQNYSKSNHFLTNTCSRFLTYICMSQALLLDILNQGCTPSQCVYE